MDGLKCLDSPEDEGMAGAEESRREFSELDQQIHELMQEGLRHPPRSAQQRIAANKIVRLMKQSGRIWHRPEPYYEDALFQTWEHFLKNLWEATTSEKPFCHDDCSVMARFNTYLKFRIKDGGIAQTRERNERAWAVQADGDAADIAERLPAPAPVRDVQAERVREVIEVDPTGELGQTHVRGRPEITAQLLLRRRGLANEPWQRLAKDLESRVPTLSSFYQRKCLPLIRQLLGVPERNS